MNRLKTCVRLLLSPLIRTFIVVLGMGGAWAQESTSTTADATHSAARIGESMSASVGNWVRQSGLEMSWFGIDAWRVLTALLILLGFSLACLLGRRLLHRIFGRMGGGELHQSRQLILVSAERPLSMILFAIGLDAAAVPLLEAMPTGFAGWVNKGSTMLVVSAVVLYLFRLIGLLDIQLAEIGRRSGSEVDPGLASVIRKTMQITLGIVSALFIGQSVFNFNITALLASAGVAGLAIALAAQDTVSNLLGSFVLLLDRPLKVGDRVVVNGIDGTVEMIGLRSTRLRMLIGHLVTIPNKVMSEAAVENISRRPFFRRMANLTITYDTPSDKVELALKIVRDILKDHPHQSPDMPPRVVFNEFNDCALNILYMAWFHATDWWEFNAWIEQTNLAILRAFNDAGIEFAFPTTTTYLASDPRRALFLSQGGANPSLPPS